ncbi:hypothetical protein NKR23_g4110 [Pleurostoma richardsiae]|uniref:Uncharacterized protein n=1 Tax=Pleurostoma richardsiae TaxID=41990 RepID=A0AA38RKD2_9PEZI|nr:hypothetical protein NKR23_g4110 [Pleurostoma richardsiae]
MTNIIEPVDLDLSIQGQWRYHTNACGRIPSDYLSTIICYTVTNLHPQNRTLHGHALLVSEGVDYDLYAHCCPYESLREDAFTNVYTTQYDCQTMFCYTSSYDVAENWTQCIQHAANAKIEEMKKNNASNATELTKNMYSGQCEMIDYKILKKGVQSSGAVPFAHGWTRGTLATVLGAFVMVFVLHHAL